MKSLVVVQPAMKAKFLPLRVGRKYAFMWCFNPSSWHAGFEVLTAGVAIQVGPFVIAACHIQRQLKAGEE